MKEKTTLMFVIGAVLGLGALGGCDGEGTGDDVMVAEACEHMGEGPASSVTATAELEGAPDVSESHRRFDIALIEVEGGNGGSVSLSADDSEYVVFLNADIPVAFFDGSGTSVEVEHKDEAIDACQEVAVAHHIHPGVGTVELRFGPTADTEVSIVVEADDGADHDHDHDHE